MFSNGAVLYFAFPKTWFTSAKQQKSSNDCMRNSAHIVCVIVDKIAKDTGRRVYSEPVCVNESDINLV